MARVRKLPGGGYLIGAEMSSAEKSSIIRKAASQDKKVELLYLKKTTGNVVKRLVAPYEFKDGKLYASCSEHGMQIHSFLRRNILSVAETDHHFRRVWPNKLEKKKKEV